MNTLRTLLALCALAACRFEVAVDPAFSSDASQDASDLSTPDDASDATSDAGDVTRSDGAADVAPDLAPVDVPSLPPCARALQVGTPALWFRAESLREEITGTSLTVPAGARLPLTEGRVGMAFSYGLLPHGSALFPSDAVPVFDDKITVEAWVRPDIPSLQASLVNKISPGMGDGFLLDLLSGTGRFYAGGSGFADGDAPLVVGEWSLLVGVYDGARSSLYVNGVLQVSHPAHTGPVPRNSLPLRLGTDMSSTYSLVGALDEVVIRADAISADEVRALYEAGPSGHCPR